MNSSIVRSSIFTTLLGTVVFISSLASAQSSPPEGWVTPYPAFRVIGPLYGVGMLDLSVFLITSEEGHILINTGLADSTEHIRNNIESLGFRLEDVRILLTMQAHWDHTAAMAEIKQLTGAEVWATPADARVLQDGGFSDAHFGGRESFDPVSVDRIIEQDDVITLGDLSITVHEHPGHTEGSSSYSFQVSENGQTYDVAIANMGTINPGKHIVIDPTYEGVAVDFATTYNKQKQMDVDVWVSAHASQYNMHEKYTPGRPYSPDTFVDPMGFIKAVERLETAYLSVIAQELDQ
ncbi:MAG: subclass B3 metallo-beta-lactamase [Gammaproteobacteria bacterium]|jgi:metallo-beta-lactamase class B|nr:subclass B3 metallo-beta-lactamase [Gammaproteobacteria bacterium]MDG2338046.1 subclass B3 metallo-beta-lactamase [Gammaproteobacteria bacterium]